MVLASPAPPQPTTQLATGEKRVLLSGLNWQSYQQILQALPQSRAARLTYDRGTLEITVPLENHEFALHLISQFIRILVSELDWELKTMGSTTINREGLNRGAEPDCAFYIQNQAIVVGRTVDFAKDPPPDLVVEIDITHTDIDKDQLYAAMEIPEFWRYNGQTLSIFQLWDGVYKESDGSGIFEWIEKEDLYQFLADSEQGEIKAEKKFRAAIQKRLRQLDYSSST